jgi:uncharacterized protein YycO
MDTSTKGLDRASILLWDGKGIVSSVIGWQTRTIFTHTALEIGGVVWEAREFVGVRKLPLEDILAAAKKKGECVWSRDLLVPAENIPTAVDWLDEQVGKKYDYVSVLRFITRRQADRKALGKWFCSELTFVGAEKLGAPPLLVDIHPAAVSPAMVAVSPVPGLRRLIT